MLIRCHGNDISWCNIVQIVRIWRWDGQLYLLNGEVQPNRLASSSHMPMEELELAQQNVSGLNLWIWSHLIIKSPPVIQTYTANKNIYTETHTHKHTHYHKHGLKDMWYCWPSLSKLSFHNSAKAASVNALSYLRLS